MADWHGELSFRSEYVYRGYSKSRGNPVVQADLRYQAESGWLLGTGISQLSFDDHAPAGHADVEVKPYLGWNLAVTEDWRTDLLVSAYIFDNKVFGRNADYEEFSAALRYQDWLSARVFLATDAYQRHATVPDYELNFRRDLLDNFQFSGGLGYSQAVQLLRQDYFYWNMGFSWFPTSYLVIDMRYVDVHLEHYPKSSTYPDAFYPQPLANKYLISITLGF